METTILGLSFCTRMLGLAVIKSDHLVDYSIKLHKALWSPQKRDLILASLASCIECYNITYIAISIPESHHQTNDFKELLSAIESFGYNQGIPLVSYQTKEIYQNFGSPVKRTRQSLMKRLIMFYPELSQYYDRECINKNKYYIKLFEAVAVASYHWLELKKK